MVSVAVSFSGMCPFCNNKDMDIGEKHCVLNWYWIKGMMLILYATYLL